MKKHMNAPFPHRYSVSLVQEDAVSARIAAPPRPAITGGAPPEFGGSAGVWSPEHLLLSAASLCLMTTFRSLARRAELDVRGYKCATEGVLEKTPEGLVFTSITHRLEIHVAPGQIERARGVVVSAKKHCIVSNSLKTPVEVVAEIG